MPSLQPGSRWSFQWHDRNPSGPTVFASGSGNASLGLPLPPNAQLMNQTVIAQAFDWDQVEDIRCKGLSASGIAYYRDGEWLWDNVSGERASTG